MKRSAITALALCVIVLSGTMARGGEGSGEFSETIRQYVSERDSVSQFYDLAWSGVRSERMEKLYKEWQGTLKAANFDALNTDGRIDSLLLGAKLDYEIGKIKQDRARLAQIDDLLPFRTAIQEFESARWRMTPLDAPTAATTLASFPEQIKKLRERLEKGRKKEKEAKEKEAKGRETPKKSSDDAGKPIDAAKDGETPKDGGEQKPDDAPPILLTPLLAHRTARASDEIRKALKTWYDYHNGYQPEFSWWMKKPFEELDKSLEEYAKFLREELAGLKGKDDDPLLGEPLGAEGLARDIAVEWLPYNADELLAVGEREFAACEARMKEASREMGLGDDWKAALAKVKTLHVAPGKQDAFIAEQAADAIAFVKKNNLVTVPPLCEETWRISMIPPDGQKQIPYAAYSGMHMLVAYARDDMKHADKLMSMRGNNQHFTRIVTAHELIPGHHLQSYFAQRYRQYRTAFSTSFFVEGWALYWEMALWDKNYARSPEDKVGMLFWRMHRAARIIVTLKFHLGQMTPQQMIDFLVDRVGHEKFGATSEVRRFISGDYAPLYQCGYMIGGLQLRALSKEIVSSGKMTEKQFNDAVLRCGTMPVEMIRASLLQTPLARDSRPAWKFDQQN